MPFPSKSNKYGHSSLERYGKSLDFYGQMKGDQKQGNRAQK